MEWAWGSARESAMASDCADMQCLRRSVASLGTHRFASTLTSCCDLLEAQLKRVQSRQPDKSKLGEWPYAHLHVGVSVSVGEAVGANVGDGVGAAVGDGVGVDVGAGVGA